MHQPISLHRRQKVRSASRGLRFDPLEARRLLTADPGWSFGLGGPSIESETAVGVGPDGAVYITGSFAGTVDLDPGPGLAQFTTNQNVEDGFVAKYTQQGQLLWANTFGGSVGTAGNELSRDVEFDAAGNVYLVGISSASQPRFGSITLANQSPHDVFVAKVDGSTGNFVWARRLGGTGNDLSYDAAVTPAGEVFVAGHFDATVDFDPGAGTHMLTSAGDADAFIWKLDAAGNFAWVRQFGGTANDTGQRVALGNDGHVYAVGTFRESVDFGDAGDPLVLANPTGAVTSNTFVVQLDETTGDSGWARQIGGLDRTTGVRVAADGTGSLYVAGGFEGTLSLEAGPTFTSAGGLDIYLSKWNSSGDLLWAESIGGTGAEGIGELAAAPNGDPRMLLSFEGTVDVDPGLGTTSLTSAGGEDSVLLKLNASGELQHARQISGPGTTVAYGVAEDSAGNTFVTGFYQNSVSLPTGDTLTRTGNGNFVVKLAPEAPTKFFVVDAAADKTNEYDALGNRQSVNGLAAGNTSPVGAASNLAGDRLWVIDANKKVFVYDNTGALLGSWTASGLNTPQGITTNGTDLWIVDGKTDKVYKYSGAAARLSGSQGAASSFNLNSQNSSATDVVTDGASIWVVNSAATDKVFKYTLAGTLLGSWTIDSRNSSPTGITLDPSNPGTLWIVDNAADQVFAYMGATSRTSGSQSATIAVNLGQGNTDPQGIADPPPGAWSSTESNRTGGYRWNEAAFGAAISNRSGKTKEAAADAVWADWS